MAAAMTFCQSALDLMSCYESEFDRHVARPYSN